MGGRWTQRRSRHLDGIADHVETLCGFSVACGDVSTAIHAWITGVDTPAAIITGCVGSKDAATLSHVNSSASILIRLISLNEVAQPYRGILSDRNSLGVVPVGSIQQDPVFQRSRTKLDASPGGKTGIIAFDQIAA